MRESSRRGRGLLYGGLAVGTLDALDAVVFFGLRGVSPVRIFQSIAAGLLGRAAFQGGLPVAGLGLLLHFGIAFTIVAIYSIASTRIPTLARRPFLWGPLFGLVVYFTMNLVVLPLSAATSHWPPAAPQLANGVAIHMFGVGLPSALFARWGSRVPRS